MEGWDTSILLDEMPDVSNPRLNISKLMESQQILELSITGREKGKRVFSKTSCSICESQKIKKL